MTVAAAQTPGPDDLLVDAVLRQDRQAAEILHGRFQKLIGFIAWRFTRNRTAAEDLAQDIWAHLFLVALACWRQERGSLAAFIEITARNKAIDWLRRQGHASSIDAIEDLLAVGRQLPDSALDPARLNTLRAVRDCVDRIPNSNHRRALELKLNGYSYVEIAGILCAAANTVGVWVNRAKEEVKPCLEKSV